MGYSVREYAGLPFRTKRVASTRASRAERPSPSLPHRNPVYRARRYHRQPELWPEDDLDWNNPVQVSLD